MTIDEQTIFIRGERCEFVSQRWLSDVLDLRVCDLYGTDTPDRISTSLLSIVVRRITVTRHSCQHITN